MREHRYRCQRPIWGTNKYFNALQTVNSKLHLQLSQGYQHLSSAGTIQ